MIQVGTSAYSLVQIHPDPSALEYGIQDVSAPDAGRVNDTNATMYKLRVAQKRKLKLTWNCPTDEEAHKILQAFNPEYFYVRYYDVLDGQYETRCFYSGDKTAPMKWFEIPGRPTRYSTLSFDIIER